MATLLLRLAGPLQSWGIDSKFETRRTNDFPTKSGVIGLLAAALGYSRNEPLDTLTALNFGIRIDKEGNLLTDYHIAKGKKKGSETYVTNRFYLADAIFVSGLESEDINLLKELEKALKAPAFPLYLGRRSCIPTMPLVLGIRELPLVEALQKEPWQLPKWQQERLRNKRDKSDGKLRLIIDAEIPNPSSVLRDLPISFSQKHRKFALRPVQELGYVEQKIEENIEEKEEKIEEIPEKKSEHDVFHDLPDLGE